MAAPLQVGSPEWWLKRLTDQLAADRGDMDLYASYYSGDHPLPWLAPQARDEFRRILRMTRTNYMGLVVDAMVERAKVEGFRQGVDTEPDDNTEGVDTDAMDADTWRIWQANNMDAGSSMVFKEAAICCRAYLQIEPNPADRSTPFIYPEHPTQAIVDYQPGTARRVRRASLKTWVDDWTNETCATVQLPGNVFKWTGRQDSSGAITNWVRRDVTGEQWGGPNLAGEVTMVEIPNNPGMLTGGVSEIAGVIDIQDRINKTVADRLITQDYGAFPQKWMSGWPTEDEQGSPVPLIDIGRNRFVATDSAEAHFGQWDAAPLDPYSAAKREDVKDIASGTRTPAIYLLGEMNNIPAEALQVAQVGLIAKTRDRCTSWGEGLEDAMRIVRRLAGLPDLGAKGMETIWRNPEFRTLGELTDAVVKKLAVGIIDLRQAREDAGYSATQIRRMESREAIAQDLKNKAIFGLVQDTGGGLPSQPPPDMQSPMMG